MKSPPKAVCYSGGKRLQVHITESSSSTVIQGGVGSACFRLRNLNTMVGIVGVDRCTVKPRLLQASCDIQPRICAIPSADEAFVMHVNDDASFYRHAHVEDYIGISLVLHKELSECFQHLIIGVMGLNHVYHLRQNIL